VAVRTVLGNSNVVNQIIVRDRDRVLRSIFDDRAGYLSADRGDLPLEVANSRFAGVMADDSLNAFFAELKVLGLQSIGFDLLRNQESAGDLDLFVFGVAREAQDFHAILQRLRNRVHDVGSCNEHHLRQIVLDVEVVVLESGVLLRIENFKKR